MTSALGTARVSCTPDHDLGIRDSDRGPVSAIEGTILLTGATGGIGQAIARALAARGASLVLTGRRQDALMELADEISGRPVACDLAERDELRRLVDEVGAVDILVANAAHPASGVLTELDQESIDRMLEVNLRAPIALARALAPGMASRGRGHLVFISSLSGKVASASSSIYSATKFGLRGFALGLREDLRPSGVGVSVVLPGFIREAGMFAQAEVDLPRGVGTRSPDQVATAVMGAIEHNRAEVDVAPLGLRLGASLAGLAPELAAKMSRRMGGERIAADLTAGQRHIS
jgi:short-subunit dehydrogenase